MDVRGSETQEAESGVDQQILPAVVLDEALSVVAPVVLENEPRPGVIQISPADESSLTVTEIRLDIRLWQAGLDQQPPKPSLHRRFGGSRKCGKRAETARACATSRRLGVASQSGSVRDAQGDRHVDGNQGLHRGPQKTEIEEGAEHCCRAQPSDRNDLPS